MTTDATAAIALAIVGSCDACGYVVGCRCNQCKIEETPNVVWFRCTLCCHMTYNHDKEGTGGWHHGVAGKKAATFLGTRDGRQFPPEMYGREAV